MWVLEPLLLAYGLLVAVGGRGLDLFQARFWLLLLGPLIGALLAAVAARWRIAPALPR